MTEPAPFSIAPMEARLVDELPTGDGWQFEPKWDGFRCIAYSDGDEIELRSKSGKPLARYFPDVVALLRDARADRYILDGELIIPIGACLSFGALQTRLHPAESRVRRLAAETPAQFMLFDCLRTDGQSLLDMPLRDRRAALEALHAHIGSERLLLSPCAREVGTARAWLERSGGALDGVVAKRLDEPYRPGGRAMLKVKQRRTADCVVGGFRYDESGEAIGSLLLGLHDDEGLLHHVGFTSALPADERRRLAGALGGLIEAPGFTGRTPGGPSRWATARSAEWQALRPELVIEVTYDQVTDDRFRHGTGFLRWRPDKAPAQCRMDQLRHELRPAELAELANRDGRSAR